MQLNKVITYTHSKKADVCRRNILYNAYIKFSIGVWMKLFNYIDKHYPNYVPISRIYVHFIRLRWQTLYVMDEVMQNWYSPAMTNRYAWPSKEMRKRKMIVGFMTIVMRTFCFTRQGHFYQHGKNRLMRKALWSIAETLYKTRRNVWSDIEVTFL